MTAIRLQVEFRKATPFALGLSKPSEGLLEVDSILRWIQVLTGRTSPTNSHPYAKRSIAITPLIWMIQ